MLPRVGEVTSLDRQQLDISKAEEIRGAIRRLRPALIINAAAPKNATAVSGASRSSAISRTVMTTTIVIAIETTDAITGACV